MSIRSWLDEDRESVSEFYEWRAFYYPDEYPTDPEQQRLARVFGAVRKYEEERRA